MDACGVSRWDLFIDAFFIERDITIKYTLQELARVSPSGMHASLLACDVFRANFERPEGYLMKFTGLQTVTEASVWVKHPHKNFCRNK